jgi:hypothetical protein
MSDEKPFAEVTDVTGDLTIRDHHLRITGSITVSRDGSITLHITPVPLDHDTKWLLTELSDRGRLVTWGTLRASAPTAPRVESDHINLLGRGTTSGATSTVVTLEATASQLTIHHHDLPPKADLCRTIYHTVGMRGIGSQTATTPAGTIKLAGVTHIKNYDNIAGCLNVTATSNEQRSVIDWLTACDNTVEHLLQIISLAEMKRIQWSSRQTFHENQLLRSDYYGSRHTTDPYDGMFQFLNLQPVLDLAINNYTQDNRDNTGIELAINLLLINPGYTHLILVNGMTALEHLISVYLHYHPLAPPVEKNTFTKIMLPALNKAYDAITAILERPTDPHERDLFEQRLRRVRDRLPNLNHTTFTDHLFAMLNAYGVPLVGIKDRIKAFIKARQDIIHTGEHDVEFKDFYLHIAVIRELLKRIVLTLLHYQGEYISFLNGQEFLHFPPTNVTVVP